jgi:polycomb group RING finger protein 4
VSAVCRGCIIQRLNAGPRVCPICKTSAVAPLAADVGLQRLVYLVVPGLFRSEQERRRHFRQANPQCPGLGQPPLGAPDLGFDDLVSLSLCEHEAKNESSTRYLKCPAGVTVRHLLRLLMLKRGWDDEAEAQQRGNSKIEMMYEVGAIEAKPDLEVLDPAWTLMDLACIFEWERVRAACYFSSPSPFLPSFLSATTATTPYFAPFVASPMVAHESSFIPPPRLDQRFAQVASAPSL